MHSLFSDGRAEPEAYIAPAIESNMSEIGFSDHLTLFKNQQHWNMSPEKITSYLNHIRTLGRNTEGLIIRTGLEVDYFAGKENETAAFLKTLDLDYVLGSVHYLGEKTVDEGPDYYLNKNLDNLFENYFEQVCNAASSGLFDIIAHCDLVRIYGYRPSYDPAPLYRRLAKVMRQNNVAFEVNTNGRNRPLADFYPDRKYLYIFQEEGVPVCVNSDAHMPMRVGQYFDEAYELLRSVGFNEMATFEKRVRRMVPF